MFLSRPKLSFMGALMRPEIGFQSPHVLRRRLRTAPVVNRTDERLHSNRKGDKTMFTPSYPRPGYNLMEFDNVNKLANDIIVRTESEIKTKQEKLRGIVRGYVNKNYPNMPYTDRNRLRKIILSSSETVTEKSVLQNLDWKVSDYVRNEITDYNNIRFGLNLQSDIQMRAQISRHVDMVLASWRKGGALDKAQENEEKKTEPDKEPSRPRESKSCPEIPWYSMYFKEPRE